MRERRGRLGLAFKAFPDLGVPGKQRGEEFEGHRAFKLGVLGFIDHAHAALTEFFGDPVVRDGLIGHETQFYPRTGSGCRVRTIWVSRFLWRHGGDFDQVSWNLGEACENVCRFDGVERLRVCETPALRVSAGRPRGGGEAVVGVFGRVRFYESARVHNTAMKICFRPGPLSEQRCRQEWRHGTQECVRHVGGFDIEGNTDLTGSKAKFILHVQSYCRRRGGWPVSVVGLQPAFLFCEDAFLFPFGELLLHERGCVGVRAGGEKAAVFARGHFEAALPGVDYAE